MPIEMWSPGDSVDTYTPNIYPAQAIECGPAYQAYYDNAGHINQLYADELIVQSIQFHIAEFADGIENPPTDMWWDRYSAYTVFSGPINFSGWPAPCPNPVPPAPDNEKFFWGIYPPSGVNVNYDLYWWGKIVGIKQNPDPDPEGDHHIYPPEEYPWWDIPEEYCATFQVSQQYFPGPQPDVWLYMRFDWRYTIKNAQVCWKQMSSSTAILTALRLLYDLGR